MENAVEIFDDDAFTLTMTLQTSENDSEDGQEVQNKHISKESPVKETAPLSEKNMDSNIADSSPHKQQTRKRKHEQEEQDPTSDASPPKKHHKT